MIFFLITGTNSLKNCIYLNISQYIVMLRIVSFIYYCFCQRFNLIIFIYKYILLFAHDKHHIEHDSTIEIYNDIAMSYLFDVYYNLFHSTTNRNHLFLGQELFLIFFFLYRTVAYFTSCCSITKSSNCS